MAEHQILFYRCLDSDDAAKLRFDRETVRGRPGLLDGSSVILGWGLLTCSRTSHSLESFGLYLRKPCPSVPARFALSTNEVVGAKGDAPAQHTANLIST